MLVDGTMLKMGGRLMFESDVPVSLKSGKGELGISAIKSDANVKAYLPGLTRVVQIKDAKTREISNAGSNTGIEWKLDEADGNYVNFSVYNGAYTLYLNDKQIPGHIISNMDVKIVTDVDGTQNEMKLNSYYDHEDKLVTKGNITLESGFYEISNMSDNLDIGGYKKGDAALLSGNLTVSVKDGKDAYLKLTGSKESAAGVTEIVDYNTEKNTASVFKEAENYDILNGTANIYTTRSFLSGGAGVTLFNELGDNMVWNLEVPEDGTYNLLIKYVSWDPAVRFAKIGNLFVKFKCPLTAGYGSTEGEWRVLRIDKPIYLEKGTHPLTIWAESGLWNIDWIGLKKQ